MQVRFIMILYARVYISLSYPTFHDKFGVQICLKFRLNTNRSKLDNPIVLKYESIMNILSKNEHFLPPKKDLQVAKHDP